MMHGRPLYHLIYSNAQMIHSLADGKMLYLLFWVLLPADQIKDDVQIAK